MFKIKMFLALVILFFTSSLVAQAGDAKVPEGTKDRGSIKSTSAKAITGSPKGNKMMHNAPTLVATSDGGVVLLADDKLIKYDKNLTLVKEITLHLQRPGECDCPKVEKKKIQMKTRELGQPGKPKPSTVPAKK